MIFTESKQNLQRQCSTRLDELLQYARGHREGDSQVQRIQGADPHFQPELFPSCQP